MSDYVPRVGDYVFVTRYRAPDVAAKITSILFNGMINVKVGPGYYIQNVLPDNVTEHPLYRGEFNELNTD